MTSHVLRRPAALTALAALVATILVAGATSADAATVDRIAGTNRYDTGAKVSEYTFADPADVTTVYVATGRDFPDALAAGAAAASLPGPVVLTDPSTLVTEARDELRRLQPDEVVLVGGPVALSDDVAAAIEGDTAIGADVVRRVAGSNRFATAAEVTVDAFPDGVDTVFLATGRGFPDALAGVPAAARFGTGLLLTEKDTLPSETAEAIEALGAQRVVILGGTTVVSFGVESELRDLVDDVDRISGGDRFETAAKASADAFRGGARTVFLATGRSFPDALTGGPAAAVFDGPLLLTERDVLPEATIVELQALNPRTVVILGGDVAVAKAVEGQVADALSGSTALPSGATPDFAFGVVDNREGPRKGLQTINLGTLGGDYESVTNPTADEQDNNPIFNEQGTRVAFLRSERFADFGTEPTLHVVDIATGTARQLLDLNKIEFGCGFGGAFWSPDGSELVVLCPGRTDDKGTDDTSDDESLPAAYRLNLRGETTQLPVPQEGFQYASGAAAPSGSTIALSGITEDRTATQVHTLDLDALGDGTTKLADTPNTMIDLQWSADGSTIAGSVYAPGLSFGRPKTTVATIDVDSGVVNQLQPDDAAAQQEVVDVSADGSLVLVLAYTFDSDEGLTDTIYTIDDASSTVDVVAQGDLRREWITSASFVEGGTRVLFDDLSDGRSFTTSSRPTTADEGSIATVALDGTARAEVIAVDGVIAAFPEPATSAEARRR